MRSSTHSSLEVHHSFSPEMVIRETQGDHLFRELIANHGRRTIKQRRASVKRPVPILTSYELNHPRPLMRNPERITSPSCSEFRTELDKCYQERLELENELDLAESQFVESENLFTFSRYLLIGHLLEWFKRNRDNKEARLLRAEENLRNCPIKLDEHIASQTLRDYKGLYNHFIRLSSSEKICNIFSHICPGNTPETAVRLVSKDQVSLRFGKLGILSTSFDALHLENVDYGSIYIYPHFMVLINNRNKVGVANLNDVEMKYSPQYYLEDKVPSDTVLISQNPSRRNKYGNSILPIKEEQVPKVCLYGVLEICTTTGLQEKYCFSNHNRAEAFADAFWRYQKKIKNG